MTINKTQRILKTLFWGFLAVALVMVVVYESHLAEQGALAGNEHVEFIVATALELLTLCCIPLALRMFKMRGISERLKRQPAEALLLWGSIRLSMLGVLLVACVWFYYFFMKPTFGYLAIILLLSMLFVVPTRARCEEETRNE